MCFYKYPNLRKLSYKNIDFEQQWIESAEEPRDCLEELPLPLVEDRETSVLCVGPAPLASPRRKAATSLSLGTPTEPISDDRSWRTLEEMLLQVAQGAVPMIFKPTIDLYTSTSDAEPLVPQGGIYYLYLYIVSN